MQVQMWEHFAQQADQPDCNADKAANLLEALLRMKQFQTNEENLEFIKRAEQHTDRLRNR